MRNGTAVVPQWRRITGFVTKHRREIDRERLRLGLMPGGLSVLLSVEALAPLEHLVGEGVALPVDTVAALSILQHARNDRSQLELDLRKCSATLPLIVNVLAHRFSQ